METVAAALIAAGGSYVSAQSSASSNKRIARKNLQAQEIAARKKATADLASVKDSRETTSRSAALAQAAAQAIQNRQLASRGISGRPQSVTSSVLDEGLNK
jgi:hypothetical protein